MKRVHIISIVIIISLFFLGYYFFMGKNDFETIKIKITKENFDKIQSKRNETLDIGILLTSKEDYVPTELVVEGEPLQSKIRLKGDWVDHLSHETKRSFRVKFKKGKTVHGMKKFSLQHPATRNYIYEWVFHKMQEEMGLVSLRYEFVKLVLEIDGKEKNLGIYALEEAFDKRLIENNNRRSGVILKFDESALWENRVDVICNDSLEIPFEKMYQNSKITSFNKSKVRKDSTLSMQFRTGAALLNKYRKRDLKSSEVFDLEKMAKFITLVDLFGGEHAVIWHNLRFYYNPVTALLEPIGFDVIGGKKYDYVIHNHIMGLDSVFLPYHIKELEKISNESFLENFKLKYSSEMNTILKNLNTEFEEISFDEMIFSHNLFPINEYIKKNQTLTIFKERNSSIVYQGEKSKTINDFDFIKTDSLNKTITFLEGNWTLNNSLTIPKGFTVETNGGLNLDLVDGAEIISESRFVFIGSQENSINIFSSDSSGDGLFINTCSALSVFENVNFTNLSNPKNKHWSLTGAITIYKSDVEFQKCKFSDNRSEDALNIFSSNFIINNCIFNKTASDAFDGDFVTGSLSNCKFNNLGNDAIDISGSNITLKNIDINFAQDKGISAGEKSIINGENIYLRNSELAITSKDSSFISLSTLTIDSCKVGFSAFQKKSEYSGATINVEEAKVSNTQLLHLVEANSNVIINGVEMSKTDNVIERLYGNEFGKSSK